MQKITFATGTDLEFSLGGVSHLSSGTVPHNPAEARVVIHNAETPRAPAEINAGITEAAAAGQAALELFVRKNFQPIGRVLYASFFNADDV